MRNVAIWFAGLLASGIFGWLVDAKFLSTTFFPDGGPGMIGGMLAFACIPPLAHRAQQEPWAEDLLKVLKAERAQAGR